MRAVEWSLIDPSSRTAISQGDLVSAEAGGLPIYEVMRVADGRVWLREEQSGRDHVAPVGQLRWIMRR